MIDRNRSFAAGFTIIELLVVMFIYGILMLVAMPQIQNLRMMNALSSGQQAVTSALLRGRWLAINRGDSEYVVRSTPTVLQIRSGSPTGTVLASADLSNYSVTVDDFTAFAFDSRGFLPTATTLTVRQGTIQATKALTINVYGKVVAS